MRQSGGPALRRRRHRRSEPSSHSRTGRAALRAAVQHHAILACGAVLVLLATATRVHARNLGRPQREPTNPRATASEVEQRARAARLGGAVLVLSAARGDTESPRSVTGGATQAPRAVQIRPALVDEALIREADAACRTIEGAQRRPEALARGAIGGRATLVEGIRGCAFRCRFDRRGAPARPITEAETGGLATVTRYAAARIRSERACANCTTLTVGAARAPRWRIAPIRASSGHCKPDQRPAYLRTPCHARSVATHMPNHGTRGYSWRTPCGMQRARRRARNTPRGTPRPWCSHPRDRRRRRRHRGPAYRSSPLVAQLEHQLARAIRRCSGAPVKSVGQQRLPRTSLDNRAMALASNASCPSSSSGPSAAVKRPRLLRRVKSAGADMKERAFIGDTVTLTRTSADTVGLHPLARWRVAGGHATLIALHRYDCMAAIGEPCVVVPAGRPGALRDEA